MLRDWLLTPVINAQTQAEEAYNEAHCGTRCTVERCIGVLKRHWHCLHNELRVAPAKACKIICACIILHNRATVLHHALPEDVEPCDHQPDNPTAEGATAYCQPPEQARVATAKLARERLIQQFFN